MFSLHAYLSFCTASDFYTEQGEIVSELESGTFWFFGYVLQFSKSDQQSA